MQRATFSCCMKLSSPSILRLPTQSTWSIKAVETLVFYIALQKKIFPILHPVEEVSCIEHSRFLSEAGYFPMSGDVTGVQMVCWASELVSADVIGVKSSHEAGCTASGHNRVLILWLQLRLLSLWNGSGWTKTLKHGLNKWKTERIHYHCYFLGMALAKCEWNTVPGIFINQTTLFCNTVKSAEYIHAKKCSPH